MLHMLNRAALTLSQCKWYHPGESNVYTSAQVQEDEAFLLSVRYGRNIEDTDTAGNPDPYM